MEFEELQERWVGRPYQGMYVAKKGRTFSIDDLTLISHIEDNLYVGGCIDGVDLGDFFDYVFSLYRWEQYTVGLNTKVYTVTMYDAAEDPDPLEIDSIAEKVSRALDQGGNVLVHCQAGINRSNLIAAATLVKRGRTPSEAIELLREKRHHLVLANENFERFVRSLDG